jgi:hypothetical protein
VQRGDNVCDLAVLLHRQEYRADELRGHGDEEAGCRRAAAAAQWRSACWLQTRAAGGTHRQGLDRHPQARKPACPTMGRRLTTRAAISTPTTPAANKGEKRKQKAQSEPPTTSTRLVAS